jgi:hypothetical protein
MSERLIRILKRRSSYSLTTLEELIDVEFLDDQGKPDLSLSVFRIDPLEHRVQVLTEQLVGNGMSPQHRAAFKLDALSGWTDEQDTPTTNKHYDFPFSSRAHRELQFDSADEVQNLAATFLVLAQAVDETRLKLPDTKEKEMRAHARERFSQDDPDWLAVCDQFEKVRD